MWKKGWLKSEPGKSRTFGQQGVRDTDDMGYYAEGKGKNGQTIYWAGTTESFLLIGGVHPTKSFNISVYKKVKRENTIRTREFPRCRYYEPMDSGYEIHQAEDFWCVRGKQGNYGEAGGGKYDYSKGQPALEGCEYVPFKNLPRDGDVFVSAVHFGLD
jgi:hypothetical protein